MKFGREILGLLAIVALLSAPLSTTAWTDEAAPSSPPRAVESTSAPVQHKASCHVRDNQTIPDSQHHQSPRAPSSYQCCLTGHDAAVAQTYYSSHTPAQSATVIPQIDPSARRVPNDLRAAVVLSADPLRATQLRI